MDKNTNGKKFSFEKNPTTGIVVDLFGPSIEFLTLPDDPQNDFCLVKATTPPGTSVPLHSHPDTEDFIIISGKTRGLRKNTEGRYEWIEVKAGDYVHIPSGAPHAWHNVFSEPVVSLVAMTKRLTQFVQETGRPITAEPMTSEDFAWFAAIAAKYGHWIATPEENAAFGIHS